MNIEMLAVVLICLLVLPIFYRTVAYTSKNGVVLFIFGFSALFIRLLFLKYDPLLATVDRDTLPLSLMILLVPLVLFIMLTNSMKGEVLRGKSGYLVKLLVGYLFFGALQQIFFLTVFTDAVYYVTSNYVITFIISVTFFFSIHLKMEKGVRMFLPGVLCFGIINTFIYLWLGNILPQVVLHGVFGSILYTAFADSDQVKHRLGTLSEYF